MDMEISLNVINSDKLREVACQGRLYLTLVFPYLRRNERKTQNSVNILFVFSSQSFIILFTEYPVFVDLKSHLHSHLPEPDVMRLAAGEVRQRCTVRLLFHDPQIHLKAVTNDYAALCRPLHQYLFYVRKLDKDTHHFFWITGCCKDINIFYCILPSP